MKKLVILLLILSAGLVSRAQINSIKNITGNYGYKYNESYHGVTFSEEQNTFVEYDKDKNVVSKGSFEQKDDFYILTPKETNNTATINVPVKFKVREILPKKLVVEIYFSDKKTQILNLVKL
jgi:hypothetical protein